MQVRASASYTPSPIHWPSQTVQSAPNVFATNEAKVQSTPATPVPVTGTTSSLVSSESTSHIIQATQETDAKHTIASPFAYMTDSDKKLVEAATGWTIGADNKFYDKNGNAVQGQGLSNHSLDLMMMTIQGARVAQSQGISIPSVGTPITAQQFADMAGQWKANASYLGETFTSSLISNGLAYLNGRDGTAVSQQL